MFKVFYLASFFVTLVVCNFTKINFDCNDLHVLYDESKNLVNLNRIYDNLLRKNGIVLSEHEIGFEFFKSKPIEYNISELYLISDIFTATATLFYDRVKAQNVHRDIRHMFQNYSDCFLNPKAVLQNYTSENLYISNINPFRSIDGFQNNPRYPKLGSSYTSYSRLIKPQYDDKIHSVRKSVRGYNLPSTRNIVRKLFLDNTEHLNKFHGRQKIPNTGALMFGQLVAHDVGSKQAAQYIDGGDEGIRCCSKLNRIHLPAALMHSSCLPITISKSDPFYSAEEIKCMGFVRSNIISNNPYRVEIGEQVNTVTSFLDLSGLYGSDYMTARKIRTFQAGILKTNAKNILPEDENGKYFAGDDRITQTPFLALWHSIFLRNHNNLAYKLSQINYHWGDNRLFQEARRINIAIYQRILYEEWLPIFLGKDYCNRYGLTCNCNSLFCDHHSYDINVSTMNEFAASAFRYMHSFINSEFELYNENFEITKALNLSDTIMKSHLLEEDYDNIVRGFVSQGINLEGYSSEVLNKLFKNNKEIGIDLLSIDIQRERDHGVPAYLKFRNVCKMNTNVSMFDELYPEIPQSAIKELRSTYKSVYDIDLLVGGALENISTNNSTGDLDDIGFFGPTFKCIIGEQFYRFKMGDSYFYTNSKSPNKFTKDQLKQIKKYNVANLLCDNTNVSKVPKNAFFQSNSNLSDTQLINCDQLEQINLNLWKEVM